MIGAAGLLIALVFNTVGVWAQLHQAAETRRYTQLGVLSGLAADARASDRQIESGHLPELRCDKEYRFSDLKPTDEAALSQALGVYDYMAWLFNEKHLELRSARRLWAPHMIGAADLGRKLLSRQEVQVGWPQLSKFRAEAPRALYPRDPCPVSP